MKRIVYVFIFSLLFIYFINNVNTVFAQNKENYIKDGLYIKYKEPHQKVILKNNAPDFVIWWFDKQNEYFNRKLNKIEEQIKKKKAERSRLNNELYILQKSTEYQEKQTKINELSAAIEQKEIELRELNQQKLECLEEIKRYAYAYPIWDPKNPRELGLKRNFMIVRHLDRASSLIVFPEGANLAILIDPSIQMFAHGTVVPVQRFSQVMVSIGDVPVLLHDGLKTLPVIVTFDIENFLEITPP